MTNTEFQKGQIALIATKYCEMRSALYNYIRIHIGNDTEAEDLLQETFTRLLERQSSKTASIHTQTPITTQTSITAKSKTLATPLNEHIIDHLIWKIAKNQVIDWYRRHALSVRAREFFATCRQEAADTTEQNLRLREMLGIEQNCIRKMGSRKADIYLLYIHRGRTSTEISDLLGLSRRTVENHIFAARNMIRKEFKKAL